MAGDWIKVEQATLDKPEVLRTAEMLGMHRREALGLFVEFWIWLDKNLSGSCPDFVRNMSKKSLDEVLHEPGFASCLESIGWAKFDDEKAIITIINAERHNGTTAKSRALDAKRKKEKRAKSVPETSGLEPDKNRTREEKRRYIKPIGIEIPEWVPKSNWDSFVEMRKKGKSPFTDQAQRLAISALSKLRDEGYAPAALIDAAVLNGWKSFYPPKPGHSPVAADPPWKGAK
jgi:hypothetical protein